MNRCLSAWVTPPKECHGVVRGQSTIDVAAAKMGHLEAKIHERNAPVVAVTKHCGGCISVHTKKAVEHGAAFGTNFENAARCNCTERGLCADLCGPSVKAHGQPSF